MPLDILQPFTPPPIKRARETISFASDGASKCAEIFVTNNADQWTFHCAYCPKAASDIGVFICHIRLEHLKAQIDLTPEQTGNASPKTIGYSLENCSNLNRMADLTTNTEQKPPPSDIVKEEITIACSQEYLQTSCAKGADITDITLIKNSIPKTQRDNEVIFTITPIGSQEIQQPLISKQVNKDIAQVVLVKNEAEMEYDSNNSTNDINEEANNDSVNDSDSSYSPNDSDSCYSPNEDDGHDTDFKINEDDEASGSSKSKIMKKNIAASEDNSLSTFKCPYCIVVFKSKKNLTRHILHIHDKQLPIRCEECQRGFLTACGLKIHLKSHEGKNNFQCPVCKTKHMESNYITHVLTHESATCFPCQVCGKLFASQEKRMTHWKTHSQEKPFACNLCYRRYGKHSYLTRHLKSHNQYHCNFCSAEFNSTEAQRPPYVCEKCEKLPDIKQIDSDENTLRTLNPVDEFCTAATNKFIPNSGSTYNNDSNTHSSYSINDKIVNSDDDDDPSTEDGSDLEDDTPTMSHTPLAHKCQYCKRDFNSKIGLVLHIRRSLQCQRVFQSKSALDQHSKFHDKNSQFKCPVCPTTKLEEGSLVAHVMLHESESCFPCQVCGKIFSTNAERTAHWETHDEEKPHDCNICYRRFSKKYFLQQHMKTHNQYNCHFCSNHFNSPHSLQPPYVCTKCEKLHDIKAKI